MGAYICNTCGLSSPLLSSLLSRVIMCVCSEENTMCVGWRGGTFYINVAMEFREVDASLQATGYMQAINICRNHMLKNAYQCVCVCVVCGAQRVAKQR